MAKEWGFGEALLVLGLGFICFALLWRLRAAVPQSHLAERRLQGVDGC
jgi:hypothetical protein